MGSQADRTEQMELWAGHNEPCAAKKAYYGTWWHIDCDHDESPMEDELYKSMG